MSEQSASSSEKERPRASSKPEALAYGAAMLAKLEEARAAKMGPAVSVALSEEEQEARRKARLEREREEERRRFEEARALAEENARRKAEEERRKTEFREWPNGVAPPGEEWMESGEAIDGSQKKEDGEEVMGFAPPSPRTVNAVFEEQGAEVLAEDAALSNKPVAGAAHDIVSPRLEKFLMGNTTPPPVRPTPSSVSDPSKCSACGMKNKVPFAFCKGCGAAHAAAGSKFVQKKGSKAVAIPSSEEVSFAPPSPRTVNAVFEEQGAEVLAEEAALSDKPVAAVAHDIVSPRLEKFLMGDATPPAVRPTPSSVSDPSKCSACGMKNKVPFAFCKGCGAAHAAAGSKFVQKKTAATAIPSSTSTSGEDAFALPSPRTLNAVFDERGAEVLAEEAALSNKPVAAPHDIVSPRLEKFLMGDVVHQPTTTGPAVAIPGKTLKCSVCARDVDVSHYSKTQIKKKAERKCNDCVGGGGGGVAASSSWVAATTPTEQAVDLVQNRADLLAEAERKQAEEKARLEAEAQEKARREEEQRKLQEQQAREAEEQRKAEETAKMMADLEAEAARLRSLTEVQQREREQQEAAARQVQQSQPPPHTIMDDSTPLLGDKHGVKKRSCCRWSCCMCCCCSAPEYETL